MTAWPWRSLLHLISGALVAAGTILVIGLLAAGAVVFLVVVVGLIPLLALSGIAAARLERWRLRLADLDETTDLHRAPLEPGIRGWLRTLLREPATSRELGSRSRPARL